VKRLLLIVLIAISCGDPGPDSPPHLVGPTRVVTTGCSGSAVLSNETWESFCDDDGNKWGRVTWYIQFPSNTIASPAPQSKLWFYWPPNCVVQCSLYEDPDTNPIFTSTNLGNNLWVFTAEIPYANICVEYGTHHATIQYRRIYSSWWCDGGSSNTFENCAIKGFPTVYCLPCNCPHEEAPVSSTGVPLEPIGETASQRHALLSTLSAMASAPEAVGHADWCPINPCICGYSTPPPPPPKERKGGGRGGMIEDYYEPISWSWWGGGDMGYKR
jgi:hypothetical protein